MKNTDFYSPRMQGGGLGRSVSKTRVFCCSLLGIFFFCLFMMGNAPVASGSQAFLLLEESGTPLQGITLPWEFYTAAGVKGVQGIAVLDAHGEQMPVDILFAQGEKQSGQVLPLSWFFLPDIPDAELENYLRVQIHGDKTVVESRRQSSGADNGFLLIENPSRAVFKELRFDLRSDAGLLPILVEGSDDLSSWRHIRQGSLAHLTRDEAVLVQNSITFPGVSYRYYRVRSQGGLAAVQGITGLVPAGDVQHAELKWRRLSGKVLDARTREYHLPAVAVRALRLAPDGADVISSLRCEVSNRQGKWHTVRTLGPFFHVHTDGRLVESGQIDIAGLPQHFRLHSSGEFPSLELGWQAHQLRFLAQGKGPYRVVTGADFPPAPPLLLTGELQTLRLGNARLGEAVSFTTQTATLTDRVSSQRILLWAVLVVGVAVLAGMAWTLFCSFS